jgi:hypothetical protein
LACTAQDELKLERSRDGERRGSVSQFFLWLGSGVLTPWEGDLKNIDFKGKEGKFTGLLWGL